LIDKNASGIAVIYKPPGISSFDVIYKLRKITGIKRIGHTGTLDPLAEGVLPVCFGTACKASNYLTNKDKTYITIMKLGQTTDTQDSTGSIIRETKVEIGKDIPEKLITKTIKSFEGEMLQMPPMYSAKKINGSKLYDLARRGETVERVPVKINIYSLSDIEIVSEDGVKFEIKCSKGTYIRTLCNDIGEKLGVGACMTYLQRTAAGPFKLDDAVSLEEFDDILYPIEKVFESCKPIILNPEEEVKYKNGMTVLLENFIDKNISEGELLRVYGSDNKFIGTGITKLSERRTYIKTDNFF
jgi:tRNA pseudouridine55 synthase